MERNIHSLQFVHSSGVSRNKCIEIWPLKPIICSVNSLIKPFITDVTIIKVASHGAIPTSAKAKIPR